MKFVEQLQVWGRAGRRRLADRVRARHIPLPGAPAPGRLDLCLDALGAPAPAAPAPPAVSLSLEAWEGHVIAWVMACGPVPVRIVAEADHPLLIDLTRFAWRLECPVHVRTTAPAMNEGVAGALVDAGVKRVTVVSGPGIEAALRALAAARVSRGVKLDVVVELPLDALIAATNLPTVAAELRAAGADGLRVGPPWHGGPWSPTVAETLERARTWIASFHRTDRQTWETLARYDDQGPGAPRTQGRCPVAGLRLVLTPDGKAAACPFQPGAVPMTDDVPAVLAGLADHRARIHACDRACVHAELTT